MLYMQHEIGKQHVKHVENHKTLSKALIQYIFVYVPQKQIEYYVMSNETLVLF